MLSVCTVDIYLIFALAKSVGCDQLHIVLYVCSDIQYWICSICDALIVYTTVEHACMRFADDCMSILPLCRYSHVNFLLWLDRWTGHWRLAWDEFMS